MIEALEECIAENDNATATGACTTVHQNGRRSGRKGREGSVGGCVLLLQQLGLQLKAQTTALAATSPVNGVHLREKGEKAVDVTGNGVVIPVGVAEVGDSPFLSAVDDREEAGDEGGG